MNNKLISVAAVILAILGVVLGSVALVGNQSAHESAPSLGRLGSQFPNGIVVGSTTIAASNTTSFTSCNLIDGSVSHAASTTKAYDCAVPGITPSDKVIAFLATSTPYATTTQGQSTSWSITAAGASSTAGYATVLLNYTGGAAVTPSAVGIGSSTRLIIYRSY